jgi:proteasome lid subunit RPN8/RPN11
VLNELCAHALDTLPEECCGLILGRRGEPFGRVVRISNVINVMTRQPWKGQAAFWMNEGELQRALKQAEEAGDEVTAIYHSHVDVGVYLSELDLEHAEHEIFPFPNADQIVIAVHDRHVLGLGLFHREGAGKPFVGRAIAPAAP